MNVVNILPPNATGLEKSISITGRERIAAIPVPLADLFSPWRCPATHLPWLAWAVSVDVWDDHWPEAVKRQTIAASVEVHRRKGTVGAVRRALAAQGYQVKVHEHHTLNAEWTKSDGARWDSKTCWNGTVNWSGPEGTRFAMTRHWAEYALELDVGDAVITPVRRRPISAPLPTRPPQHGRIWWGCGLSCGMPSTTRSHGATPQRRWWSVTIIMCRILPHGGIHRASGVAPPPWRGMARRHGVITNASTAF